MIDIKMGEVDDTLRFEVVPSNQIFKELGNNTYNYLDLISELIDNSIGAKYNNKKVNVNIEIGISDVDRSKSYFLIRDDCKGISPEKLASAISPAANSGGDSLHEHGLGMKQAIAAIGTLNYLATKTLEEDKAILVDEFRFGLYTPRRVEVDWKSGTEICIGNLNDIVKTSSQSFTMNIVPYLGARYRKYLTENNPRLSICIQLLSLDNRDESGDSIVINEWSVTKVEPVYFHPNSRSNMPIVENKEFKGRGWKAELTIGYAPQDIEYEYLNIVKPKSFEPYHVSISKQGFDLIKSERVIKFHQLSEMRLIPTRHNKYNFIRGEINLISGFTTAITKNSIIDNEQFDELKNQIKLFLDEKNFLNKKTYPDELPEALLRDRFAHVLKTHTLFKKNDVRTEYTVGNLNGKIDILADQEAWEIKTGLVNGLDVYQLFAYMDMGELNTGYLLAKEISTGAKGAIEHIKVKHGKSITFVPISDFNILGMPTEEEFIKYY